MENKTSTCFRGNNIEILLKCVLSLNKITSSQGLTFFFEIWGFNQGPLALSAKSRKLLQELKLPLWRRPVLGISTFSPAKTLHDCPGLKVKPTTECKKKSLDTSLKIRLDWLWSKSVWGKGMVGVPAHFGGSHRYCRPPISSLPCDHVHLPLPAIPFFF